MKPILLFLIMIVALASKAQKTVCYRYVVAEKSMIDSTTGFYYGMEDEYEYCREYIKDSVFIEKKLFSHTDKKTTNTFKIAKGSWYLLYEGKWKLFYASGRKINPKLKIDGNTYEFKTKDTYSKDGDVYVEYVQVPYGNFSVSYFPTYIFTPKKGFVMVRSGDLLFMRNEIKN
jgi:hypothetical protein